MVRTRDVSLYTGGMILQQVVTFAIGVVVARWLGPADYGILSITRNIFNIVLIIAPLGLDLSLLKHIAQHSGPKAELRSEIYLLRGLVMAVSLAVTITVVAFAPMLEEHLYNHKGFSEALIVSFIALPFSADLALLAAIFRGRQRPTPQIIVGLYVTPLVRLGLVVGLLACGLGILSTLYAAAGTAILATTLLTVMLWRSEKADAGATRFRARVPLRKLAGFLRAGLWLAPGLLAYGLLRSADVLILGKFRGSAEVGEYAALSAIVQLIPFLPQALSQTLGPTIAKQFSDGDKFAMENTLNGYLRTSSLITAPIFGGIAAFSPFLDLVFGTEFHFDSYLCIVMALGYYVGAILAPMGFSLSMTGRHKSELAILLSGTAVAIISCLILARNFGQIGAATGMLIGYLFINASRLLAARNAHDIKIGSISYALPPTMAVSLAFLSRIIFENIFERGLVNMILMCSFYLLICSGCWLTFVMHPNERRWVFNGLARLID